MKYHGAAALGTTVFFAPHLQDNIGLLDTTTSTFSTVVPSHKDYGANMSRVVSDTGRVYVGSAWFGRKYSGATALGTNVYFTPYARFTMHRIPHTHSASPLLSSVCVPCAAVQDADAVGVLRTSGSPPAAMNSTCAYIPPPGLHGPSMPPQSPPPRLAAPPPRPTPRPPLGRPPPLLPPLLPIVLLPASIFLCTSIAFGVFLRHVSRRSANLRRSRERAQFDLQLHAHQVRARTERPCDDGQLSCAPPTSRSAPSVPPSSLVLDDPPPLQSSSPSTGMTPDEEARDTPVIPVDAAPEGSAPVTRAAAGHEALESEMADAAKERRQQGGGARKWRCQVAPWAAPGRSWLGFSRFEE